MLVVYSICFRIRSLFIYTNIQISQISRQGHGYEAFLPLLPPYFHIAARRPGRKSDPASDAYDDRGPQRGRFCLRRRGPHGLCGDRLRPRRAPRRRADDPGRLPQLAGQLLRRVSHGADARRLWGRLLRADAGPHAAVPSRRHLLPGDGASAPGVPPAALRRAVHGRAALPVHPAADARARAGPILV